MKESNEMKQYMEQLGVTTVYLSNWPDLTGGHETHVEYFLTYTFEFSFFSVLWMLISPHVRGFVVP